METRQNILTGLKIGYALTGSFCTFSDSFVVAEELIKAGADLIPIMSENASSIDTRFGKADENIKRLETITGKRVIRTIADAEPIGPERKCDIIVVAPCTGNTMAKLAGAVTDTAVTMAVKSHIRNSRPVLLCFATNDALAGSAQNIGRLFNSKPYYFVPFAQDDYIKKPTSLIGNFSLIPEAIEAALKGVQMQPIMFYNSLL